MFETYLYWISTALLSLMYVASATLYLTKSTWVRETLAGFGYPTYLLGFLVAIKFMAVAAVLSRFNVAISDLAYAGVFYHLVLSGIAHLKSPKPSGVVPAVIGLLLLAGSFLTQNFARDIPSPYAPAAVVPQVSS